MAKKLVAVTNIRHNNEDIEAGEPVDTSLFTKDELKALYDAGAVSVEDDGKGGPDTSVSTPETPEGQDAQQVGDVPAVAKEAPSSTPTKSTSASSSSTSSTSSKK